MQNPYSKTFLDIKFLLVNRFNLSKGAWVFASAWEGGGPLVQILNH